MNRRKVARDVLLRRFGVERSYRPPALLRHPDWNFDDPLKLVVAYAMRRRPDFSFLQVGAFDGRTEDPIHPLVREFGIRGIVVEPQVRMLETLRYNYADQPQVTVVNAAIADAEGSREFYSTTAGQSRKASFFRSNLLDHGLRAEDIVAQTVRCATITSWQGAGASGDLIQIGAGFDGQISASRPLRHDPASHRQDEHIMSHRDCDACIQCSRPTAFFIGHTGTFALREPSTMRAVVASGFAKARLAVKSAHENRNTSWGS
jgi:FkbM family methyltransferase